MHRTKTVDNSVLWRRHRRRFRVVRWCATIRMPHILEWEYHTPHFQGYRKKRQGKDYKLGVFQMQQSTTHSWDYTQVASHTSGIADRHRLHAPSMLWRRQSDAPVDQFTIIKTSRQITASKWRLIWLTLGSWRCSVGVLFRSRCEIGVSSWQFNTAGV